MTTAVAETIIQPIADSPQVSGIAFWVAVEIKDADELFGVSFKLRYDTSILNVVTPYEENIALGSFLGPDPVWSYKVKEDEGIVAIGISRKDGMEGVSGTGIIVSVKFIPRVDRNLITTFEIRDIVADDITGSLISTTDVELVLDITVAVFLTSFSTESTNNGIMLSWQTASELNNLGFNVFRLDLSAVLVQTDEPEGKFIKVNRALIKGAGTDATPHEYQFVDEDVEFGKMYYYYLEDVDFNGQHNKSHIIRVTIGSLPTTWGSLKNVLYQNYPNPFNPETWIPYQLSNNTEVTITIYNAKGQLIHTIALGNKQAGVYVTKSKAAYWDGRLSYGEKVASGMYYYQLRAGEFRATRKMAIMK